MRSGIIEFQIRALHTMQTLIERIEMVWKRVWSPHTAMIRPLMIHSIRMQTLLLCMLMLIYSKYVRMCASLYNSNFISSNIHSYEYLN